ncbi:MAG: ChbG/HpnK family deacetylase [Elusimicrobia bacterium]|nr:ChbG/HpnK family deacetylase [Elusimicrobiota bacterium]
MGYNFHDRTPCLGLDQPMNAGSKFLIVNADDFGLTESVCDGILESYRRGIVTSTSMLSTGRAFAYGADYLIKNPGLAAGIHLCLDEERPARPDLWPAKFLTKEGFFEHRSLMFTWCLLGIISPGLVYEEWKAQIARCLEAGVHLDHLDGHGHVHLIPSLAPVAVKLAKEFKILNVRFPQIGGLGWLFRQGFLKTARVSAIAALGLLSRRHFKGERSGRPYNFHGLAQGGRLDPKALNLILEALPQGINELMCHPGLWNEKQMNRYLYWDYHWQAELDALTQSHLREKLKKEGITLARFGDLPSKNSG